MAGTDSSEPDGFLRKIRSKETQKLRARRHPGQGLWYGFAMTGKIGWAVVIPTLLGALLGMWLDKRWPQHFSWTLSLMLAGLILGCVSAWYWVQKEKKNIQNENEAKDE